jgi:CheY-like chemotaxis protein
MARPARILLVDDDQDVRCSLAELLQDEGFEVVCAGDGAQALRALAAPAAPNVILLDLAMPVMDGWTFRDLQRRDPRLAAIPTIVISASHAPDRDALESLHADAVLPKPFDLERLVETLDRVC